MNKGFTLIELLIVIGLLAIVSIVVATNMVGLQGQQTEKEYDNYVDKLETAACAYFEKKEYAEQKSLCKSGANPNACKIDVGTLIDNGLIAEDLYNPQEGKDVSNFRNHYVLVSYPGGEKTCTLQEG